MVHSPRARKIPCCKSTCPVEPRLNGVAPGANGVAGGRGAGWNVAFADGWSAPGAAWCASWCGNLEEF